MTSTAPPPWPAPELPERPDAAAPPARTGPDAWPAWSAPAALVGGLIAALLGGTVIVVIGLAFDADVDDTPPGILLGATIVQDIAFVAAAILAAQLAAGWVSAEHFGLRPVRTTFWGTAGLVAAIYIGFAVFVAIWSQIVGEPDDEPLLDDLGVDESTLLLILGMLTVCVAAPLVEEFFFRGFFYRAVSNWAGVWGAAALTGVVFGVMHATSSPVENLLPLAVLGALFCLLYHWTGSLYPCITLHALNNSFAFAYSEHWDGALYIPLAVGAIGTSLLIAREASRRWSARPAT